MNKPQYNTEETKYRTATKIALSLFEGWEKFNYDPNFYSSMVSTIKDVIYQCPDVHSGWASETAYEMKYKDICKEHYFSRTQSAKKMIELMQKGILNENRLDRFESFVKSRARVHYVTSKENVNLVKYQKDENLTHWKQQYDAAGIKLKKWDKSPPVYTYNIEGVDYKLVSEVANKYGIHKDTVISRCNSEKEQWKTWNRILKKAGTI